MVTRSCTVLIALLASLLVPVTGPVSAAPATFVHPGVVVSRPQLDFMRTKVNAGAQPWKTAYDRMMASKYADLNRTPKPRAVVECGPYTNPNYGCTDEREDAIAAYTLSLAWYVTRDNRYATKAIQLMDAWSATIRDHTNSNARLQTAWSASSWPKAAEIIKHVYGNWPNSARFGTMLRNVYLPEIQNGLANTNGNWELSMMEASLGISVFLEDRAAYDKAVGIFRDAHPGVHLPDHRRRTAEDAARQRHRHPCGDHLVLAQPVHVRRRPHPGDLPGLRAHGVRAGGGRALRRDRETPGPGHLGRDQGTHAPRVGPAHPLPERRAGAVVAVRRLVQP